MPISSVTLTPGVDVEKTPTLNVAGISSSSLVRFRESLIQKIGGWTSFVSGTVSGIPRDLHAWQDLSAKDWLGIGATNALTVIQNSVASTVTPQIFTSNFTPNFSVAAGTSILNIIDPNLTNSLNGFCNVTFNTPVAVSTAGGQSGIFLNGTYAILGAVSTTQYQIDAGQTASHTIFNGGLIPLFTTNSAGGTWDLVTVTLGASIGATFLQGQNVAFLVPTTGNGITISGVYQVFSVISSGNTFTIPIQTVPSAGGSFHMNSNLAQAVYGLAPSLRTNAWMTGTPISATDYTQDNWGSILLACPAGGGIYQYVTGGVLTVATPVSGAPALNGGIFVSNQQQILIAWGSSINESVGFNQNPLLVQWSDSGNYASWVPTTTNQAGNFVIPTGSKIVGGMATPNQDLIWTDIDCWSMNYLQPPLVYGFNKIGAGAGLVSSHAAQQLLGNVYWMGPSNFFALTTSGLAVMPCPVWDFVFQNINTTYLQNVRAMPNTPYNEAGWLFPSSNSTTGECDCYVKMNIVEPNAPWDCGPSHALDRSAWMDQTVFGPPIAADTTGHIWQHELGNNAGSTAMTSSFTTAYFMIGDGEDLAFIDQIIPDFVYGDYGQSQNATINLTFNVTNFPGDTPQTYGPYAVTNTTEIVGVRFRGRQMSITVTSSDLNSFWRLGRVRYRWAPSGRR